MRHPRPYLALLATAAITMACSGPPGSSGGGESQGGEPSTGSQPSQATASGGGGGGGGGGANGSVTYEITGDYQASGELPFLPAPISQWVESAGGWVASFANQSGEGAVIQINSQAAEGTTGQIFVYGDGKVIMTAVSTPDSGFDCTFNFTKNDSSGLAGDLDCKSALGADATTGAQKHLQVTAHWDAHP